MSTLLAPSPAPVPWLARILGTVLTRVDLHKLRHYDYYSSSAYIKPYAEASLKRGAAL